METITLIIIVIILAIVIVRILSRISMRKVGAATLRMPIYSRANGGTRSRLEERLIAIVEEVTGASFPQAHPSWLTDEQGTRLELDGFNPDLRLAIEVQGPHHYSQLPNESYEAYIARTTRDKLKHKICADRGIEFLALDYNLLTNPHNPNGARSYIVSRLYDIGIIPRMEMRDYIPAQKIKPWSRDDR